MKTDHGRSMTISYELPSRGPFSLRAAAEFGFGPNEGRPPAFDGAMRLAFAVDGGSGYAGAVLRQSQPPHGPVAVQLEVVGGGNPERALAQVARIVSLDHDGTEFMQVGERDRVIGSLQAAHAGQRPVLFHSPYEGACWSIISARRPAAQAAKVRTAVSERLGERLELAGFHAFPQPDRLAELPEDTDGLSAEKVRRLHGVARAALEGALDVTTLHELGPERAYAEVQRLKGLGPFYAGLVVQRASGFADAPLMAPEPKVLTHAARMYGLQEPLTLERFNELADAWRPFRTWAMVLIRVDGNRRQAA